MKKKDLRSIFYEVLTSYKEKYDYVKEHGDYKNEFKNIVVQDIPDLLKLNLKLDKEIYVIVGSCGKGLWTKVPWVAIFNKKITSSAQQGVYIVYLINKDKRELYLTLTLASSEAQETKYKDGIKQFTGPNLTKAELEKLKNMTLGIRNQLDFAGLDFVTDNLIDSGSKEYDTGTICYRKYTVDNLPDSENLLSDLKNMLKLYDEYFSSLFSSNNMPTTEEVDSENEVILTDTLFEQIKTFVQDKGFSYDENLIENYYLSLKSKPFVILAGTSGTGKTKLVKLFAEAIGCDMQKQYKLVPVRPDWSDSSDLFGHLDLKGEFVPGAVIEFVRTAIDDPDNPYFLCLDEMNLARVEYYFSDFLSIMETREWVDGKIKTANILTTDSYGKSKGYGDIYLPDNLYIVGTVNMDETTFPFSKKVLDRANTIEFSEVNLIPTFKDENPEKEDPMQKPTQLNNDFLVTKYLLLNECATDKDFIVAQCKQLESINSVLARANLHVGYRVRDEICFYMLNNKDAGLLDEDTAFDNELNQKILPRIQGSGASLQAMICELFKLCFEDGNKVDLGKVDGRYAIEMKKAIDDNDLMKKYPKSAKKLQFMMERFEEDGFTSYWC